MAVVFAGLARTQQYLKQIVYGGNDGIVTTFAIVAGFQGANAEGAAQVGALAVLVFGFANLFADAVSMGLGEFLSGRSERDLYTAQHNDVLHRIDADPQGESATLADHLQDRGIAAKDVEPLAAILARNPELLAEMVLTYRQNMPEPDHGNLRGRALMTFLAFVVFGFVPISAFVFLPATGGTFIIANVATALALVALGLLRWNATDESLLRCVGETLLVGGICAVVAFVVGAAVGGMG